MMERLVYGPHITAPQVSTGPAVSITHPLFCTQAPLSAAVGASASRAEANLPSGATEQVKGSFSSQIYPWLKPGSGRASHDGFR
jgi:hypothetical protein